MNTLVVFDVDGTLTQTMALDTELYVEAFKRALDLDGIDTDWSTYRNVTDGGVAAELIERRNGRPAAPSEIEAVRDEFVSLIDEALAQAPEGCKAIPGAEAILSALSSHDGFRCAVATGAWRAAFLLKVRCAGLDLGELPTATGDDSPSREEILRTAFARACSEHGLPAESDVVYVGDGVWDLRAASSLGWRFLGVGRGLGAEALRKAGASHVVADFSDLGGVLGLLAQPPSRITPE